MKTYKLKLQYGMNTIKTSVIAIKSKDNVFLIERSDLLALNEGWVVQLYPYKLKSNRIEHPVLKKLQEYTFYKKPLIHKDLTQIPSIITLL